MFNLFKKDTPRVNLKGNDIFIDNLGGNIGKSIEIEHVLAFTDEIPEIKVFENGKIIKRYKLETLTKNPSLKGQFLHSSIRIQANSAVMIDGIISDNEKSFLDWTDERYEAVRFQPFFLSDKKEYNLQSIGKGLFARGLHYSGTITPRGVRCICICDECTLSFTIEHIHAAFSEIQYFYSGDSNQTLLVPYHFSDRMPRQLQTEIDLKALKEIEQQISKENQFKYYNSFRCPHCSAAYVDFEKYPEIRPNEYYCNTYINQAPIRMS